MKKIIFVIILAAGFWAGDSQARPNELQTNDDWGIPIHGVQMSIAVSNTIISAGSGFAIDIEIRNSSTNTIRLGESSTEKEFTAYLLDKSGKTYQLTRNDPFFTRLLRMDLKPGESHRWTLGVAVDKYYESPGYIATNKEVPQGDYILTVSRNFGTDDGHFKIESNSLEIQIK